MQTHIKIDQLEAAIKDEFDRYSKYSAEISKAAVDEVANKTKKNVQAKAPVNTGKWTNKYYPPSGNRKQGSYKKSWAKKTTQETAEGKTVTVYSKSPNYRLTHLLEKGHRIVMPGGRDTGKRTQAFPHILPEEAKVEQELIDELEKRLNNYV